MTDSYLQTTKKELRSVLLSMPTGASYRQLNNEFKMRIGYEVPFRALGFDRLDRLCRAIPDVVRIEYNSYTGETRLYGVADANTAHIEKLVSRQKIGPRGSQTRRRPQPTGSYGSFSSMSSQKYNSRYRSLMGQSYAPAGASDDNDDDIFHSNVTTVRQPAVAVNKASSQPFNGKNSNPAYRQNSNTVQDALNCQINSTHTASSYMAPVVEELFASVSRPKRSIREEVHEFLQDYPDGIWLANFARAFEKKFGGSIDDRWKGYGTVYELLSSMKDLVLLEEQSHGDTLVKGKAANASSSVAAPVAPVKTNVANPSEATVAESNSHTPGGTHKEPEIPFDAIGPGGTIMRQKPPPVSEKYVQVQVSNVINPGLFDLQLVGKDTSDALNELMAIMQSTYNHETGDAYALPKSLMHIGQLCAARYYGNDEWHRCFITGFKERQVNVCYFDYGTIEHTSSPLRLLRNRYTVLPIQAIRARLANIQPVNRVWSTEACQCFMDLVNNRTLYAIITNNNQGVISVTLTDTSGPEDIHINNVLIEKGYAVYIPDVYMEETKAVIEAVKHPADAAVEQNPSRPLTNTRSSANNIEPIAVDTCSVRYTKLTRNHGFHVVRVDEKAYVVSAEVSMLLWEEDLVRTKLHECGCKNMLKLNLLPEEHPDMFELLTRYPIPGVIKNGKLAPILVMFELQSVVEILEMFGDQADELILAVKREVDLFNPHDAFWRSESYIQESKKEEVFATEDKDAVNRARYKKLHSKRKSLIESLQKAKSRAESTSIVEQMKIVEDEMFHLEPLVEEAQRRQRVTSTADDSSDSNDDVKPVFKPAHSSGIKHTPSSSNVVVEHQATPRHIAAPTITVAPTSWRTDAPTVSLPTMSSAPVFTTSSTANPTEQHTGSSNPFINLGPVNPLLGNTGSRVLNGASDAEITAQLSRLGLFGQYGFDQSALLGNGALLAAAAQHNLFSGANMYGHSNLFAAGGLLSAASQQQLLGGGLLSSGLFGGGNLFSGQAGGVPSSALVPVGSAASGNPLMFNMLNSVGSSQLQPGLGASLLGLDVLARLSQNIAAHRQ